MLAMSDTNINQFFALFANIGVPVAFLVPTPTGYNKSIMDATSPIRELFRSEHIHDYTHQKQGPQAKVRIESYFVHTDHLEVTLASLYRPLTKKGDPRIWFDNLRHYCRPCNLLAIIIINGYIYVINLSDPQISSSLWNRGFVHDILIEAATKNYLISCELFQKIQDIHNQGFIPSITAGDPGVGDTLEHALGIKRNNSKAPDYKGIELKSTRLTRNGIFRPSTRSTLFTRVPDEGMSYREIVDHYGKIQIPRNSTVARLQLYETLRVSRPNAYNLILNIDSNNDKLNILYQDDLVKHYVSSWNLQNLRQNLLTKHRETFWVSALSETRNGREYFRYDKIFHTKSPNASLLVPLIEADKITVDLAAHYKPDGSWRDHGMLFKMHPSDLPLLLGTPKYYDLTR